MDGAWQCYHHSILRSVAIVVLLMFSAFSVGLARCTLDRSGVTRVAVEFELRWVNPAATAMSGYSCPRCRSSLVARTAKSGTAWMCPDCDGVLMRLGVLRLRVDSSAIHGLWKRAAVAPASAKRLCSLCSQPLRGWRESIRGVEVELDACASCEVLWFDRGEVELLIEVGRPQGSVARARALDTVDSFVDPSPVIEVVFEAVVELLSSIGDW
jgi:Zn-finger nucleic acid-binding protein